MTRPNRGVKLTYDDFLLFPDDVNRHELIDGKLDERFGVEEYWFIDPEIETIAVYRLVGEQYQRVPELGVERNDTLATPLFTHLTLPLHQIFKD